MRRRLLLAALAPVLSLGCGIWAAAADEWDGLPVGAGREEVYGLCGACHSLMIVKQQGLSRDAWAETMEWMVEEQGMPELDRETLDLIIDYLAEHYGIDGRGAGSQ
ncbi:MAG: hypothetical protein QNJ30_20540 [Kiloniellales bacterium]|nr:hypothetical protein [Kiloniellales bacterium]